MREYLLVLTVIMLLLPGTWASVSGQTQVFGADSLEPDDAQRADEFATPTTGLDDVGSASSPEPSGQDSDRRRGFVGDYTDRDFIGGGIDVDSQADRPSPFPQQTSPRRRSRGQSRQRARRGRGSSIQVRTSLHVAFEYPKPASEHVSESLAGQLVRANLIPDHLPVEVLVDGQTATLRGVVATERERILAEHLVRLEPGIWKVENELVLAKPPDQMWEEPAADTDSAARDDSADKADSAGKAPPAPAAE